MSMLRTLLALACACAPLAVTAAESSPDWGIVDDGRAAPARRPATADDAYRAAIERVTGMVRDGELVRRVQSRGLALVDLTWEDTGRSPGSALGPNISDLTLQVRREDVRQGWQSALMPVIRYPNFSDRTGDVPADKFFVRVGNERGAPLRAVPLLDVLSELRSWASVPDSLKGANDLTDPRDTHFLVSAQAVFMPVPAAGKATFNPVVFNYQSAPGSPAVLTLLVTREGTSLRVIDNSREDRALRHGQELYFNANGERAALTAERLSDVKARIEGQGGAQNAGERSALARGADMLMLVQVPLKHRNRGVLWGLPVPTAAMPAPAPAAAEKSRGSDVEQAVLGHGPLLGPYREGSGDKLERDPNFPIRITVQFYKATSNGIVDDADLDAIQRSIAAVYNHADYVGSLVVPEGDPTRPTSWWPRRPADWPW